MRAICKKDNRKIFSGSRFRWNFFSLVGKSVCWIRSNRPFWAKLMFWCQYPDFFEKLRSQRYRFKMLIFCYKIRFFTKFSTFLGFFRRWSQILRYFCPRPRGYDQKWITKTDLLWDFAYKEQTWIFYVFIPPPIEVPPEVKTW